MIHNSQEVEATQMSIDKWIDKRKFGLYLWSILSSLKEGNPVTCYNMPESWGHYTWNKPVTKRQILLQFHWHEVSKVFKLIETEWWLSGPRGRGKWGVG